MTPLAVISRSQLASIRPRRLGTGVVGDLVAVKDLVALEDLVAVKDLVVLVKNISFSSSLGWRDPMYSPSENIPG
jgi:hypothetical protein